MENMDKVYEVFLTNTFEIMQNEKKGFYYNKNEIVMFEVYEITKEEGE